VRLFSRLDHPHVIKIEGYFLEKNAAYVIMPFLEGGTLDEWLAG